MIQNPATIAINRFLTAHPNATYAEVWNAIRNRFTSSQRSNAMSNYRQRDGGRSAQALREAEEEWYAKYSEPPIDHPDKLQEWLDLLEEKRLKYLPAPLDQRDVPLDPNRAEVIRFVYSLLGIPNVPEAPEVDVSDD